MVVTVSRTNDDEGLILRTRKESGTGEDEYEVTVHPGESALGYTYEEWDRAAGPQASSRLEVGVDGVLRPSAEEFDAPTDGHA